MTDYPIPANEAGRVDALRRHGVLDREPEADDDDLVCLAAQLLDVPIAALSLVDTDRQWLLAKTGLALRETPRAHAICAHAIAGEGILVVPDTLADVRFQANPLVTGAPGIRFYAGAPLVDRDGFALGTLCVMDRVPRQLNARQAHILRVLSRQAVRSLDGRNARLGLETQVREVAQMMTSLRASEEFKTRLIECSPDCIKVLDLEGRLVSMNAGGMRALEVCDFNAVRGSQWVDFWEGEDRTAAVQAIAQARNGGVGRFVGFFALDHRGESWSRKDSQSTSEYAAKPHPQIRPQAAQPNLGFFPGAQHGVGLWRLSGQPGNSADCSGSSLSTP